MAAYTWVGLVSDNWSTPSNWSASPPSVTVPSSIDTVVINNAQPCRVTAASSCLTIDFTGFTSSFRIENGFTLTVSGTAITLGAGMTYNQTTTGVLSTVNTQATIAIAFAGITIPNLTIGRNNAGNTQIITISGSTPTIKNLIIANATNALVTLAGTAITITSSLSCIVGLFANTAGPITFSGTCTINCASSLNTIGGGFNVTTGSSLQMLSNIYLQIGAITFTGTATLINTGLFTLFCPGTITFNTSTVTWYNLAIQALGQINPLLSSLNISNNLTVVNSGFSGGFAVNVGGSISTTTAGGGLALGNSNLNMLGSGNIDIATLNTGTLNINGTGTYTIGSATNPTLTATSLTINLVGTSTAQVYSTTAHTLVCSNTTLRTNNTATGANIGGSQIIWGNINCNTNQINTLIYNTTALGNLSSNQATLNGVGVTLYVEGNLSVTTLIQGTATIELNGAVNKTWGAGSYGNSIVVNKSSSAVVTAASAITWGSASRTLTLNTDVNFTTNSNTFTLSGTPLTINNSFGSLFFNVNIPASTLNINGGVIRITSNLTLTGLGATFAGTAGWDCNNLICSTAGPFSITLQQAIAYRTRTGVSLTGGTAANRVTMTSSGASNAIWTLDFGATQSLIYVNGTRIDSSGGQTVWSFGVLSTDVNTSLNWNPGVPLRTVAYTFVN